MQVHVDFSLYIKLIYLQVRLLTAVTSEAKTWPIHSSFRIENKEPKKWTLINVQISMVLYIKLGHKYNSIEVNKCKY